MEDTTMTITASAIKFAYWVPNVSGGLVVSNIEQRTDWSYDYNVRLAQAAERSGFEYALTQIRFTAGYGAENQHESVSFSHALLAKTEKLKVIAAILPGPWKPVLAPNSWQPLTISPKGVLRLMWSVAGSVANLMRLANLGLSMMNVMFVQKNLFVPSKVSGQLTITALMANITNSRITRLNRNLCKNLISKCFKVAVHVPHVIWLRVSDWYFTNGNSVEEIKKQVDDVRSKAKLANRQVKIGVNAFIIARDTEEEAKAVLNEIIAQANVEAVNAFGDATREAGAAAPEREGNWAKSTFDDLVQYNDGFKTNLIGTPQQIAERIVALKNVGVDLVLSGFLHFIEEVEYFGEKVLPLVRQLEQQEQHLAAKSA
jgi:FMNH2-dependent dimethyl sulfone monooxygenase